MDIEGDTSTLVKAFCNLPLSYEEYSWVEEFAPSFLPDLSTMTDEERTVHKIQMLQLQLQRKRREPGQKVSLPRYEQTRRRKWRRMRHWWLLGQSLPHKQKSIEERERLKRAGSWARTSLRQLRRWLWLRPP